MSDEIRFATLKIVIGNDAKGTFERSGSGEGLTHENAVCERRHVTQRRDSNT
ncbi:MAG: hypothetical protein R3C11_24595 [Planctomycetaceae bacterium]